MKEKIKTFFEKNGRLAILVLFILELLFTIFITPNMYDDEFFLDVITNNSIIKFVTERYSNWTSRTIIEFTLCSVLKVSKYLWILIECGMMALAGYSISKLFVKSNETKNEMNFMIVFLILTYPFNTMASAGWAATTVNYIWPLATGLFSLIPIRKIWDGEKIKIWQYPLYILALLFAGNQEQTCAILLGTYLLFSIYMLIKNKRIHPFMIVQTILIMASFAFIMTCPGNYVRQIHEVEAAFPDFKMLTVLDKISLGLTSTFGYLIATSNLVFATLSFVIVIAIFTNYKEKLYRVVSLIPLLSVLTLGFFKDEFGKQFSYFPGFRELLLTQGPILTAANSNNLLNVIPLILAFVEMFCLILCILLIFRKLKDNIAILVFLIGLASRLIMGFSPTIFMSTFRTDIFFEFAMIIVAFLILQEQMKSTDKNDKKIQRRVNCIIKGAAIYQYINVLLCVLLTQK